MCVVQTVNRLFAGAALVVLVNREIFFGGCGGADLASQDGVSREWLVREGNLATPDLAWEAQVFIPPAASTPPGPAPGLLSFKGDGQRVLPAAGFFLN